MPTNHKPDHDLKKLKRLLGIENLSKLIKSNLVTEIITHWYNDARQRKDLGSLEKLLDCDRQYRVHDWPAACYNETHLPLSTTGFPKTLPLLQGKVEKNTEPRANCIDSLPISYTDLYAKLGSMSPHSELTAVCLVCGQVLDAKGKGACTKHASICGGGCGIFFILQDCVGLALHR